MKLRTFLFLVPVLLMCGCANYRWTSRVPDELRTVAVPVFQNATNLAELGPITTQYTLREFQREGTFAIRRSGHSSIEVQGEIKKADFSPIAYARGYGMRAGEYRCLATVEVNYINNDEPEPAKKLFLKRTYTAETTISVQNDLLTAKRNSVARLAAEFARQIVDDVVSFPYNRKTSTPPAP